MSTPKSSYEPRHEAEVVAWQDLTEDQRDAVNGAHGYFSRMAVIADDAKKRETSGLAELDIFLPHIDEERRNHVVLIDGERGTGKTAVMLRLLVDWSASVRGKLREDIESKDHGKSPVTLDSAIVPVGLLDLQALSPKAMLGLHLAGHLQRVVEAMERRTSKSTKSAPWAPGESEELKSRKAWRKFLSAAAAAWDGNLKERQGKIDPEAYVIELEQAERERLEIGATFRAFVDALVEDYHERIAPAKKKPFFVITIDDADMNPQRTMEIFELIRVLWHPRVGFLIAGDGGLFVTVLEEHFKRAIEMPDAVAITNGGTSPIVSRFIHAGQAEALARDCYRKAIPPLQRFRTGLLAESRFIRIEPLLREVATKASLPAFGHDLTEYFVLDEQIQDALPRRIRELIDLREWLRRSINANIATPSRFVDRVWRDAFERAEVTREARAFPWVTYHERFDRLDVLQGGWTPDRFVLHSLEIGSHVRGTIYDVAKIMAPPGQSQLPDELALLLKLAVNISMHERGRGVNDAPGLRLSNPLVVVEFQFIVDGVAFAKSEWDIPQLESFLDYTIFLNTWRKHANAWLNAPHEGQELAFHGADRLACRFLELVLNHIDRKWKREGDQIHVDVAPTPPSWDESAQRFIKYLSNGGFPTAREKAAREWAQANVCLLAAPEFGLSASAANTWLEALQAASGDNWETIRKYLQDRRRAKSAKLGDKIDALSQDYTWTTIVTESDATWYVDNIIRRLTKIPVRHPYGITWPPNLAEYLIDSRFKALLKIHNGVLSNVWNVVERAPRDVAGAEEITVFNMWEAAVPQTMRVRDYVQWDGGRSGLKVSVPPPSWALGTGGMNLRGGNLDFMPVVFRWVGDAQNTISYSDPFLRLAWDVAADKVDAYPEGTRTIATWPGAKRERRPNREWRWPIPNWIALIDWELMIESWSAAFNTAVGLARSDDSQQSQRIADALAFWYVCRVVQMSTRRNAHVDFRFELKPDDWYNLGMNLPHTGSVNADARDMVYEKPAESKDRSGARWDAHKAWWDSVVIMAAPESGISPQAAEGFLKGLYEKHDIQDRPVRDKSQANGFRREHAIRCGTLENQVDQILAQIDKENPDHPWHKFFATEKA